MTPKKKTKYKERQKKIENVFMTKRQRITRYYINNVLSFLKEHWLKITNWTTFSIILITFILCVMHSNKISDLPEYNETRCGVLLEKKQASTESGYFKNYFWVKYNTGVEEVEVNDNSYFRHEKNDRVCFTRHNQKYEDENFKYPKTFFTFLILWIIGVIIYVVEQNKY